MQPKEDDPDTQSGSSSLFFFAHFPKNSRESGFVNTEYKKILIEEFPNGNQIILKKDLNL